MKKIIVANWKMNPRSLAEAKKLAAGFRRFEKFRNKVSVIAAPPFVYFSLFSSRVPLAAQNAFFEEGGAYTGEISSVMLKSVGIKYVILGHSERREYAGETDSVINFKVRAALRAGLFPILCIGEKGREEENFQMFVKDELRKNLEGIPRRHSSRITIAYEPIWAVGTGKTVKPEDLFEMITYIRRALFDLFGKNAAHKIPVLYGGSVGSKNAKMFLGVGGVNGLLVGGASLDAAEFEGIIKSAL